MFVPLLVCQATPEASEALKFCAQTLDMVSAKRFCLLNTENWKKFRVKIKCTKIINSKLEVTSVLQYDNKAHASDLHIANDKCAG